MVNVLVLCSGSVAAIKVPELLDRLRQRPDTSVRLVATCHSLHFLPALESLGSLGETVLLDEHEWSMWKSRGDPVLHIELRRWADVGLVVPCSANSLAKLATGLADNLVTSTLRAWDFTKPVIVAPAMNTCMWDHPVTRPQIRQLESWGYTVLPTVEKVLVCGDLGQGAMASIDTVLQALDTALMASEGGNDS